MKKGMNRIPKWRSALLLLGATVFLTWYLYRLLPEHGEPETAVWQQPVSPPLRLIFYLTPIPPTPTSTLIPDITPPETIFVPIGAEIGQGWYRSAVTGTFQATDDWTGVGRIEYRFDERSQFTKVPEDHRSGPGRLLPLIITGEGQHKLEYYGMDSMGNVEVPHTATINIDLTAPAATHTLTGHLLPNGCYSPPVTLTLNGQDALSGLDHYELNLNDSGWLIMPAAYIITATGQHTLTYRAVDRAGNNSAQGTTDFIVEESKSLHLPLIFKR